MLRAAGVARLICENWKGPEIDEDDVILTMLVHDLGNIAKIDSVDREFKKKFIQHYGNEDHIATYNIVREVGLKPRIRDLVLNLTSVNNERTADIEDYEMKVCAYSDQRVAPYGVVSLEERIADLGKRYPNSELRYPRSEKIINAAFRIEEEILQHSRLEADDITEEKVSDYFDNLRDWAVQINQTI